MSAQIRHGGASPPRGAAAMPDQVIDPGGVAFDRWLKGELGRLYDATVAEPVPEALRRLLDTLPTRPAPPR